MQGSKAQSMGKAKQVVGDWDLDLLQLVDTIMAGFVRIAPGPPFTHILDKTPSMRHAKEDMKCENYWKRFYIFTHSVFPC